MNISLSAWQNYYKSPENLIVQASTTDHSDGWQPFFPIGMQYSYIYYYRKGASIQIGNHENTVLCCIKKDTDKRRRPTGINREQIVQSLERRGIPNQSFSSLEYYKILPHYKFVISPEGNGIDCHRHYEALIAGCIPIIEYNSGIQDKYKGCPVLYTKDYSEITEEYLLSKYAEMRDQTYDFSALLLSNYSLDMQMYIKHCGNYWTELLTGNRFYE